MCETDANFTLREDNVYGLNVEKKLDFCGCPVHADKKADLN